MTGSAENRIASDGCWITKSGSCWTVTPMSETDADRCGEDRGYLCSLDGYGTDCECVIFKAGRDGTLVNVDSFSFLFSGFERLKSIDFSGLDFDGQDDFDSMFENCESLVRLDLSEWDVSEVSSMSSMFSGCSSLEEINLTGWNAPDVNDISWMFNGCGALRKIVGDDSLVLGSVENAESMFDNCDSLESLNLSSFDMRCAENLSSMFSNCTMLVEIDLSGWDAPIAEDVSWMFSGCSSLRAIDLSFVGKTGDIDAEGVVDDCDNLEFVYLRRNSPIKKCIPNDVSIELKGETTIEKKPTVAAPQLEAIKSIDRSCAPASINDLTLSGNREQQGGCWLYKNAGKWVLVPMEAAEASTRNVKRGHLPSWQLYEDKSVIEFIAATCSDGTRIVPENLSSMFVGCERLVKADLSGFDVSAAKDLSWMFCNCSSLERVNVSGWSAPKAADLTQMFCGCSELVALDGDSTFAATGVKSAASMFCGCSSLASVDLSAWDVSAAKDLSWMFCNCSSLERANFAGWRVPKKADLSVMFSGCDSLKEILLSDELFKTLVLPSSAQIHICDDRPHEPSKSYGKLQAGLPNRDQQETSEKLEPVQHYCTQCGSELFFGARFCFKCGAPVSGDIGADADSSIPANVTKLTELEDEVAGATKTYGSRADMVDASILGASEVTAFAQTFSDSAVQETAHEPEDNGIETIAQNKNSPKADFSMEPKEEQTTIGGNPCQTKDSDLKLSSLYKYLKEIAALRSRPAKNIGEQVWSCELNSLPLMPGILEVFYRDAISEEESYDTAPILSVTKPDFKKCPQPPEEISVWLKEGWDNYASAVQRHDEISVWNDDGEEVLEFFDDDQIRLSLYDEWSTKRDRWAEEQKRTAFARKLFADLYQQRADLERDSETLEIVVGNGFLKDKADSCINHPLLTKRVRIDFDSSKNCISVFDTDTDPEIYSTLLREMSDLNLDSVRDAELDIAESQLHPLDRFEAADFMRGFVRRLSSSSDFDNTGKGDFTNPDSRLLAYMRPVVFVRKRIDGTVKAIEKIVQCIEESRVEPPAYLVDLVCGGMLEGEDTYVEKTIEQKLAEVGGEDIDILLAKEANREQLEIARRIEDHNAVLVQGPPGTGKTHTIANLMGHFLSQGKSILVTSQTRKALSVLKEKLPDSLQSLCVSVLDDSNRDMERSVEGISDFMSRHSLSELDEKSRSISSERDAAISELADARRSIFQALHSEHESIIVAGQGTTPVEAAQFVREHRKDLEGVIPGSITQGAPMPLSGDELRELYGTNGLINDKEESELNRGLPNPASIMSPTDFESILGLENDCGVRVGKIAGNKNWNVDVESSSTAFNVNFSDGTSTRVSGFTAEALDELSKALDECGMPVGWKEQAVADGKKGAPYIARWMALIEQIKQTDALASKYLTETIGIEVVVSDEDALREGREDLIAAKDLFARKGKIGAFDRLRNKNMEIMLGLIRVDGRTAESERDCVLALDYLDVIDSRAATRKTWTDLMESRGAPSFDSLDPYEPERIAKNWIAEIEHAINWYATGRQRICDLMNKCGMDEREILRENPLDSDEADVRRTLYATGEVLPYLVSIAQVLIEAEDAKKRKQSARSELSSAAETGSAIAKGLFAAYEAEDSSEYRVHYSTLVEVDGKRETLKRRAELLTRLDKSAPEWAFRIEKRDGVFGESEMPKNISDAWVWAQYAQALRALNDVDVMELEDRAASLGAFYRRKTAELAEARAWRHLLANTGRDITLKQSLEGWKQTMKRIGKGTGKRAPKLKAQARAMMAKCQKAVPAWIMPMSKALESLDPSINKFDVVIVDEASQSDVTALAVTFMAKKIIIVGDDKQVSPMAVGVDQTKADNLADIYIKDEIPNYHLYGPTTSLYDIAATTFRPLMLQEHFRCVPDIIGYSNKLSYDYKIKPLRDASSSNLLPAVVCHRVASGCRLGRRKVNDAEATEIVALMLACIDQPEYEGKTFGVISMLGDDQAKAIQAEIFSRIPTSEIEDRRILCGNASNFQGDERDVIFLSLVDSPQPDQEGPLAKQGFGADDSMRKRYNVATSRARDQLWVVHSLDAGNDLKEGDLRRDLITYAQNPSAFKEKIDEIENKSESPFESGVAKALTARGIDVVQQWEVGSFRIDMVACGETGKVAIECDGERWHSGDDKIREDMERQAILERLGWRFIRIRGSEYYQDPEATIERVVGELGRLGVFPVGLSGVDEDSGADSPELLQRVLARAAEIAPGGFESASDVESLDNSFAVEFEPTSDNIQTEPTLFDLAINPAATVSAQTSPLGETVPKPVVKQNATTPDMVGQSDNLTKKANDVEEERITTGRVKNDVWVWKAPKKITRTKYQAAVLSAMSVPSQDYDRPQWRDVIASRMEKMIEAEQPIERQRLFNAVRGSMGIGRSGRDIQAHNEFMLRRVPHVTTKFDGREYIWAPNADPDGLLEYRYNYGEDERRVDEVPYEEIRLAIVDVMRRKVICGNESIIRSVAWQFGFRKMASRIKAVFTNAFEKAVEEGILVELQFGKYSLSPECDANGKKNRSEKQ